MQSNDNTEHTPCSDEPTMSDEKLHRVMQTWRDIVEHLTLLSEENYREEEWR